MTTKGEVISLAKENGWHDPGSLRRVKIKTWNGTVELLLKAHDARAFEIGREVEVTVTAKKK